MRVLVLAWALGLIGTGTLVQALGQSVHLRGDPGDLGPVDPLKSPLTPPPRQGVQQTQRLALPAFLVIRQKGDLGDLVTQESRPKNQRQSYSRHYKPRNTHYNKMNRHSDNKKGKGGFRNSNSYNGKSGYSTSSSYDKKKKDAYGDSDHKSTKKRDRRQGGEYGSGSGAHRFLYGDYYK